MQTTWLVMEAVFKMVGMTVWRLKAAVLMVEVSASGGGDSGCSGTNSKIIGRANGYWRWMWQRVCEMVF